MQPEDLSIKPICHLICAKGYGDGEKVRKLGQMIYYHKYAILTLCLGSCVMKSIDTLSHLCSGMGRGCNRPVE